MGMAAYGAALRVPGVRLLLATSVVARLPLAMTGLAIVLRITRGSGSYSDAGLVAAASVVGAALLGPRLGRAADRFGRRAVLVVTASVSAAGVIVLSVIPVRDTGALIGVALLAGMSTPPVGASVRSLWSELATGSSRDDLYAVDSSLQELTFVAGPALVALVGAFAGTAAPLVASALLGLSGSVALAMHPALASRGRAGTRIRSRVISPALSVLVLTGFLLVLGCSVVQLGVIGYCVQHHAADQSGLVLALWSSGSIAGGLAVGARVNAAGETGYVAALALSAAGFLLLTVCPDLPAAYPIVFVAGLFLVPALGCLWSLAGKIAPPGVAVETFSWIASGAQAGVGGGAAIGGYLVGRYGTGVTFVAAAAAVFVAAMTAALSRKVLAQPRLPAGALEHP